MAAIHRQRKPLPPIDTRREKREFSFAFLSKKTTIVAANFFLSLVSYAFFPSPVNVIAGALLVTLTFYASAMRVKKATAESTLLTSDPPKFDQLTKRPVQPEDPLESAFNPNSLPPQFAILFPNPESAKPPLTLLEQYGLDQVS